MNMIQMLNIYLKSNSVPLNGDKGLLEVILRILFRGEVHALKVHGYLME